MNIQNIINQLSTSQNPMNMIMSILPKNQKEIFSNLATKQTNIEKAQTIADICNKNRYY